MATEMHKRAVLVSLKISSWSARKYDKKVTQETNAAHGADADAGRYNKKLIPGDAPEYKALIQHINEMRDVHYQNTLPWTDDGWRILTIKNYAEYMELMRKGRAKFEDLLDEFVSAYPRLRADARVKLNGMWRDEDYPSDIEERFSFAYEPAPMPSGGDYRVDLPAAEIKLLEKRTEERVKAAYAEAQNDAVRRLYEVVANIKERLSATREKKDGTKDAAIFRDSLIQNARDLCDVLKRINLNDDPKLEQFRRETELLAGSTEPETLREDAKVRTDTATRAQSILDAMNAVYGKKVLAK